MVNKRPTPCPFHIKCKGEDRVLLLKGKKSEVPCRVGILPIRRVISGLNLAYNGEALCKKAHKG